MSETDDSNPYRSPGARDFPETERRPLFSVSYRVAAILQCVTIAIGVLAAFWEIESILGSGPILMSFGVLTVFTAIRSKFMSGVVFGASGPLMTVGCFVLINASGWGPSNAQWPISMLSLAYACTFGLLGVWTIFAHRRENDGQISSFGPRQ